MKQAYHDRELMSAHVLAGPTVEQQGEMENTGMGSLSLLQWIFPTQKLNQGFLHCIQVLHFGLFCLL